MNTKAKKELRYCPSCNQMTNHSKGRCLKCETKTKKELKDLNNPRLQKPKLYSFDEVRGLIKLARQELLGEVEDGLENKVMVHSKYNFCDKCQKKIPFDRFTMFDNKSLKKLLKSLNIEK